MIAENEGMNSWRLQMKEMAARLIRLPLMRRLMVLGLYLVVPRHRAGVAVVVLDSAGQVLMLRHVFHPLAPWGLPGGWLGRRESLAEGALRELREETGLTAVLGPVVHTTHEGVPPHLGIAYLAWAEPGPFKLSGEIIEAGWFAPDNLPQPMYAFVYDSIQAAVAVQRQQALLSENERSLLVQRNDFSRQTA
jgi:ADP-ribose pyrophosphatase YjhB (NUDIX family)